MGKRVEVKDATPKSQSVPTGGRGGAGGRGMGMGYGSGYGLPYAQMGMMAPYGMMGYGMAKAAVHQLVKSLATSGSGLPDTCCVAGILPVTLDTPMNRKFMPGADT